MSFSSFVIIPDSGSGLLRQELALAFNAFGFEVRRPHPKNLLQPEHQDYLPRLLEQKPALLFSINLQGLLPGGEYIRLPLEAGVPVVGWFVDNPWNLISGMRDPLWKKITLAVTDQSFIQPLLLAGAANVLAMPLAACPVCMSSNQERECRYPAPDKMQGIVFAGRSVFPGKEEFFKGQTLPVEAEKEIPLLLANGKRLDFAYWVERLGLSEQQDMFWPGKKARGPGFCATESNLTWRELCLKSASVYGLTLFGDSGWSKHFGKYVDLRPPIDYYAQLPAIYKTAEFSLNLNSLVLNAGLSQRIFDVWIAGGVCLTDDSPGLNIFPDELTRPISFHTPEELPELAVRLKHQPKKIHDLKQAWKDEIFSAHTYQTRLKKILQVLQLV